MDKPTNDQILAEPAGERLDAWVEQFLFGYELYWHEFDRRWVWDGEVGGRHGVMEDYSTTWSGAGRVIDWLDSLDRVRWQLSPCHDGYRFLVYREGEGLAHNTHVSVADTIPEAVCKAAIVVALGYAA